MTRFKVVTALGLKTAIANFIIDTDNAISIVEKRSFIELCTALNSNAPDLLIKASAMSNHIFNLRAATAGAIKDLFAANPATFPEKFVHFTTDCWTAKQNRHAFLGITAHWMEKDFTLRSLLLALKPIAGNVKIQLTLYLAIDASGSHTGKNLEVYYADVIRSFGLLECHGHVTVDSGSNNNTLFKEFSLNTEIPEFDKDTHMHRCLAHVINLAAVIRTLYYIAN
ncbi:hypothetical protein PsorP6_003555 [Peronosclerospora sorghi]|uniref:Uncharacterized protein n=1 Tax=Peronosclerospora sorghi TaxID=230839 RepID=A0ACC0VQZ1_9STRA|nr:hypothetical protein PsorP6_003555 [Peronosclerospora sorghi]